MQCDICGVIGENHVEIKKSKVGTTVICLTCLAKMMDSIPVEEFEKLYKERYSK